VIDDGSVKMPNGDRNWLSRSTSHVGAWVDMSSCEQVVRATGHDHTCQSVILVSLLCHNLLSGSGSNTIYRTGWLNY